ncbi:MAG: YDG domain-containing protein [Gallionella sp.]|nr:YDG domain-containing protein [Gallionella sp.]
MLSAQAVDQIQGGVIQNSGTVSASSLVSKGGRILLEGDDITLKSGSKLDASGASGGGTVLVGGDWQGSGSMHQATTVTMEAGASIDASATQVGNGGKVVLWSDVHNAASFTSVQGAIRAKGGVVGGNGGQVETSGHQVNIDGAKVNAGAPAGAGGEWLIDPYSYTIGVSQVAAIVGDANSGLNSGTSVTVDTALNNSSYGSSGNAADAGDITVTTAINKTLGGDATLTLKAARHISLQSGATISASSGLLNLQLWSDSDNSGDGIVQVTSTSLNTNGGWLKFGNNQTASINGSTVLVGGDVYFNGASAQTISTGGGALDIYGETIVSNTGGLTLDSGGGNVGLHGVLNSGNLYTYVDGPDGTQSWTWARTDAKNGTAGGAAVGNSYLVTITSRLENALAGLAAGYKGGWIGAYRANPTSTFAWTWADGPEAGAQFYTQNSSGGGGTTTASYYSNFGSGEPNGTLAGNESAGQFFGTAGLWNDLTPNTTFSATPSTNQYAVLGYVRETNLASSAVTINAGTGQVTIDGGVGGSKALASLAVNAASTTINGSALVTTGAQTYDNALTVNSTGNLHVAASALTITNANKALSLTATGNITVDSPSSVAGPISIYGGNVSLNNSLTATASGAAILISANGNITTANTAKTITTNNGNLSLIADADANGTGQLDLDYTTMSAGSGNVLVRGETMSWAVGVGQSPTITSTTGTFTFESSDASFGQGVDTAWFYFPTTLSGFTVGKSTNTQDVSVSTNALSVNGPISLYGGNISVNANLTSTASGADVLLKGSGSITLASNKSISTTGGDVTFWADSDSTNGGYIWLNSGSSISTTSAANIILSGGNVAQSALGTTGFAMGMTTTMGNGVTLDAATLNSYGGDIAIRGKSTTGAYTSYSSSDAVGSTNANGIRTHGSVTVDSGSGLLSLWGYAQATSGSSNGIEFSATGTSEFKSSSTSANAIAIDGTAATISPVNAWGVYLWSGTSVLATNDGGISITGSGAKQTGVTVGSGASVLANSGPITLTGTGYGAGYQAVNIAGNVGQKAGSTITSSSSDITVSGDVLSLTGAIASTGQLTLQSYGTSFASAFTVPSAAVLSGAFSALTIGKTTNTANITVSSAQSIAGPISIYGGNINVNANLTSTSAGAKILLKGSGNVIANANLVTDGGDITLWADSDASGAGGIQVTDNRTLDSRTASDRTAGNTSTASGGGSITLAGGLDDGGAASGSNSLNSGLLASDGRPDGYAVNLGSTNAQTGVLFGNDTGVGHNAAINLYSGGGDIAIHGKATTLVGGGPVGVGAYQGLTVNAGTSGDLTLVGVSAVSGVLTLGMDLAAWRSNGYVASSTFTTANGNVLIVGRASGGTSNFAMAIDGTSTNRDIFAATGTGSVTLDGQATGTSPTDIRLTGVDVLAASGNISLIGRSAGGINISNWNGSNGVYLGAKAGSVVTSSTSNVLIEADAIATADTLAINTSGAVTVAPYGSSFTSALTWPQGGLTLAGGISGLTLGKTTNTADITVGSAQSIAGPINIYGGNIAINAALTATNSTISLTSSGNITDGVSGYLVADNLLLLGGNVTLDHASNNVNTLAASGVSGLTYTDSNALTIGSVGSTNGITATGAVALTAGTLTTTQAINAGSSNITLSTDSLALGANVISTGALQIQPKTTGATLGIGTGSGTVLIGADQLAWLQDGFSSITLGGSTTGAVQIGGLSTWNDPLVAQAGTGTDLQVVGNMSWSHANSLTLKAGNNIFVNANLAASNAAAALNIFYGGTNGATTPTAGTNYFVNLANRNTIQLTGSAPTLTLGNISYTVVNDVTALQGMSASGNYALGHGLSLAGTSYSTAFYTPTFTGKFDGLGNTLDGLTISNTAGGNLGLFAQVNGATVRQVGVTNMSITTNSTSLGTSANTSEYRVGGVIGNVGGAGAPTSSVTTLDGIWSTGTISTTAGSGQKFFFAGGLVGSQNGGTMNLSRSYSLANVSSQGSYSSNLAIGGLIGDIGTNTGLLTHTATTSSTVAFTISKDYSTGSIVEGSHGAYYGTGGLVGVVFSSGNSILDSYSWSNVVGNGSSFGGIAGFALAGTFDRLYTTQSTVGAMTGGTGTSVYNASTLNTSGGTVLPSGFSSNDWGISSRPTLKSIPTPPTQIYVKESTSSGTYGNASTAYQLVDASGNPITLGMGSYAGLSGTTGTAHYSMDVGNTTTPGTYSLSYLSGLSFTGANALDFILNPYSTATSYTLAKAPLTVTANTANKVYDGATYGGGYSVGYSAFANGETSSVLGGTLSFSGTSQAATNSGTYTIVPSGLTSNNYSFTYVNGSLNIDKRPLTLSGSRVYDGTTGISVGALIASNLVGSDCASGLATCGMTGSASVASQNVNAGSQTLTLSGLTLGSTLANNYTLTGASGTASITAKTVTLSASKTYDGTTSLTGAVTLGTGIAGETLTYTGATANDAHVATVNKYINTLTLADATDLSGGLASNYQLPTLNAANAAVTISTKALTSTANIGGTLVKTYDGTTSATAASVSGSVSGAVSGDTLSLDTSGVTLAYNSSHVAGASSISASGSTGYSISSTVGSLSSDYSFSAPTIADATASITPTTLTLSLTNTGVTKTYDGNTDAPSGFTPTYSVSGLISGDTDASLSHTGFAYDSKNVLDASKVTVTGLSITSLTGGNNSATSDYILDATSKDVAATITAKSVTLSASKTYDGTTSLTGAVTLGTGIAGETLTYTGATANDAHVATAGKYISALTLADATDLSGGLASNYQLPTLDAANAAVTISTKALTATASIGGTLVKAYDGTTAATAANVSGSVSGAVSGDTLSLDTSGVTLTYNSSHVAGASSISASGSTGYSISSTVGSLSSDYSFSAPMIADASASITPTTLTLSLTNTGVTKVYDGTVNAPAGFTPSWSVVSGLVTGDTAANVTSTGASYNSKDVITANTITVSGVSVTGIAGSLNSANSDYAVASTNVDVAATITPRTVSLLAEKTYDGTTDLTDAVSITTGVGSETLTYTGATANDAQVATSNKFVNAINLADGLNGGLASNYQLPTLDAANAPVTIIASANSMPPVLPPPTPPVIVPTPEHAPPVLGDITPSPILTNNNAALIGSSNEINGGAGSDGINASGTDNGNISVQLVKTPSEQANGLVTVAIPKAMQMTGLSFALPEQLVKKMTGETSLSVTQENGMPLPEWLHFIRERMSFEAMAIPPRGLPLKVIIAAGGYSVVVSISDATE